MFANIQTSPPYKVRVDHWLVEAKLYPNVKAARAGILAGEVLANTQRVQHAGAMLLPSSKVRLKQKKKLFVSRAGYKLQGYIIQSCLGNSVFMDKVVLDVGASTGGFTDCALKQGASLVYALDVGTNQLHYSLRIHPNVLSIEKTHIKDAKPLEDVQTVICDVSFTSLTRIAPYILNASPKADSYIFLVKPQFELEPHLVSKGGIIHCKKLHLAAVEKVLNCFDFYGLKNVDYKPSDTLGASGNQEYLLYMSR